MKPEDPIIFRFLRVLPPLTGEKWEKRGEDVSSGKNGKNFDYLLCGKLSGKLIEVEITEVHRTFGKDSVKGLQKYFREELLNSVIRFTQERHGKTNILLRVEAENIKEAISGYRPEKRAFALLRILEQKGGVFPLYGEPEGTLLVGFSPGMCSIGLCTNYDAYEMAYKDLRRLLVKKSKQFSDIEGRSRVLILVDRHPYAKPVHVRLALKKLVYEEKVGANVNEVFFLPDENNPRKIDENSEGLFTRVFDKPEQVYPSQN